MNCTYSELEQQAETEAKTLMAAHPRPSLTYHNLNHIHRVVDMIGILCNYYHLDERRTYLIKIAGWFHDIGYYTGQCEGHELCSSRNAEEFLRTREVPEEDINLVKGCILATHMPQSPKTQEEEIICDADLSHMALPDFYAYSRELRKELEITSGKKIKKKKWLTETLNFLKTEQYFTSYGKEKLEAGKAANIALLEKKLKEEESEPKNDTGKSKEEKPSKGIETMFRITSNNNQKLSSMADNKAHIMISVNSIILSAIISLLLRKLAEYEYLSIPTYIILSVSVLSMIFSLMATRPNLPSGKFSDQDVKDKKVNLLFFGNFYKMSLADYTQGMQAVMNDYDYLYDSLIKDVYSQGVVLSHKYKLLRISYTIFMFGMMLSVLSFIIASTFFKPAM